MFQSPAVSHVLLLKGIIHFAFIMKIPLSLFLFANNTLKEFSSLWNNRILNAMEFCCDRPDIKYNSLRDVKYESQQWLLTWLVHVNDFSLKFRHNEYSIKLQWSWLVNYQHLLVPDLDVTSYHSLIIFFRQSLVALLTIYSNVPEAVMTIRLTRIQCSVAQQQWCYGKLY